MHLIDIVVLNTCICYSVVGIESAPELESDSSPYFWDSDSDLDSDFAHETKVKAIHELLVND